MIRLLEVFERPSGEQLAYCFVMLVLLGMAAFSYFSTPVGSVQAVLADHDHRDQLVDLAADDMTVKKAVDAVRERTGKPKLRLNSSLTYNARSYAHTLATRCSIQKHSNLKVHLGDRTPRGVITAYAENLAIHADSLDAALNQLEQSPSHFNAMTGPYTELGVAVVRSADPDCGGAIFVVEHFASLN